MPPAPSLLAAVDVGNHRVLALIAEVNAGQELVIRGVGMSPANGMRLGQVVQMKPLVQAIKTAVEEAELMANLPVERVLATICGPFVTGRSTRAAITLGAREREVTPKDLEQLHEAARRQPLPPGHMILNVLTPSYGIDDQDGIVDPQEMVGHKLIVDAYVLACQEGPVRSLEKAINEAGLEVEEFVFTPVASAAATLTHDERRLGALVIDLGYGAVAYAALFADRLVAAGALPLGSNKINDDLVHRFQTTAAGAERAKREAGTLLLADVGEEETTTVPTIDGRGTHVISRLEMCKIIRMRLQETFELIARDVQRQAPPDASFIGVVLTGGGSHLDGLGALAEKVFVNRVRLGELEGIADATQLLSSPELPSRSPAAAVGLLAYGKGALYSTATTVARQKRRREGFLSKLRKRVWKNKEVANDHV